MTAMELLAAAAGCGAGAMLRYWLSTLRGSHPFPWPTLVANALGTALLGATVALVDRGHLGGGASLVIGGGIAGGLTTFSTLAVDAVVLFKRKASAAVAYLAVTGVVGIAAGALGWLAAVAAVGR